MSRGKQASYIGNMDKWGSGQNVVVWGVKHKDETWKRNEHGWLVGGGNKWKDGTSENSMYKAELWLRGWNVENMSCGIFYESEDYIQVKIFKGRGWGSMCWECGLGMSGKCPVKLVWLWGLGYILWSFCDCWTLCFGLSSFLPRKDWLTTPATWFSAHVDDLVAPWKGNCHLISSDITQLWLQLQSYSIPTLHLILVFLMSILKKFSKKLASA
jgi:hypothetical protein